MKDVNGNIERAKEIKRLVWQLDSRLREDMMDAQDAAEEDGVFSAGFFTGDCDTIPVCVPEDAAPDLDIAIGELEHVGDFVQSCIDHLEEHFDVKAK